MSLRTPLGRVLGYGSAKEGTEHFFMQRVSALSNALLGSWFLVSISMLDSLARDALLAWIAQPVTSILLLLLTLSLARHSSLGVQVVIEDYVHGPFIKLVSLVAAKFAHLLVAAAAAFAILKIAFGGAA